MLDYNDPAKLADEVRIAEEFRAKHTSRSKVLRERYMANWYRDDHTTKPVPQNFIASYIAFMLPELAFSAPSCRIKPRRTQTHQDIAEFIEMAMKSWIEVVELGVDLQLVVRDALLGFGVMKTGMESSQYHNANAPLRPFACRIAPEEFILDPRCDTPKDARYMGHVYFRDTDDLMNDPHYDQDEVRSLSTNDYNDDSSEVAVQRPETPGRKVCRLVDLWIPESGKICTLAHPGGSASPRFVRPPTDYWGPEEGPYTVFGLYTVPGDPYPISPIQFAMEQIEEISAHKIAAASEAATQKSFVIVDATAPDAAEAVRNANTGDVLTVKNFKDNVLPVTMGGANPQRLDFVQVLQAQVDRDLGFSDAQRGRASGATATEASQVQANSDLRTEFMRQQTLRATQGVLKRVGWYMFYDQNFTIPVSRSDPMTGQSYEGEYRGGPWQGTDYKGNYHFDQTGMDWLDFFLTIEPQSMQRSDDAQLQQRTLQTTQLAFQMAQALTSGLGNVINLRWLVDMWGQSFNQSDLWSVLFNPQVVAMMQGNAFAGQPVPLPSNVNPELAASGLGIPMLPPAMGGMGQQPPQMGGMPFSGGGVQSPMGQQRSFGAQQPAFGQPQQGGFGGQQQRRPQPQMMGAL